MGTKQTLRYKVIKRTPAMPIGGFTHGMLKEEGALEIIRLVLRFLYFFFFQSGKPLLFFPVPKSDFKATNLEGIQAKLLLFNVGEMEEWESYLLCLPVTSESLLWVPWIHANNLITQ